MALATVGAPIDNSINTHQLDHFDHNDITVPTTTRPESLESHDHSLERRGAIRYDPVKGPPNSAQVKATKPTILKTTDLPTIGKDLTPYVQDFQMAHKLKMASKSRSLTKVSEQSLLNADIPATLRLMQGSFKATGLPEALYLIEDEARFEAAKLDIANAKSKASRIRLNPQYGELAVQSLIGANLFDPANSVLSAVTGADNAIVWHNVGSGIADPVPDGVLLVNGRMAAVVEIKTTTALDNAKFNYIMKKYRTYVTETTIVNGTTKVVGIVEPPGEDEEVPVKSPVSTMEQVIAQMYAHKVDIGALTNLDSWIILEKTEEEPDVIKVTRLAGVVDGKSRDLDIILAMTDKVAHKAILSHRPRV